MTSGVARFGSVDISGMTLAGEEAAMATLCTDGDGGVETLHMSMPPLVGLFLFLPLLSCLEAHCLTDCENYLEQFRSSSSSPQHKGMAITFCPNRKERAFSSKLG